MRSMIFHWLLIFWAAVIGDLPGQPSLAEKLGYEKDAKLLIIHADDLGSAHSENAASLRAMQEGSVSSASIMMPCAWVGEVAEYARRHAGQHDLGLHLTITCEWKNYKWGPVASKNEVPSLIDQYGYFHPDCSPFTTGVNLEEVERELRAQIDLAYALGIQPTHFDSHMGCLFFVNPDIFEIYLKLSREYGVPCFISKQFAALYPDRFNQLVTDQDIVVDYTFSPGPSDFAKGMDQYYTGVLRSLQPGLTEIIIHAAYDDAEMQAITVDHPDWGATWRQADFEFFMSEKCKKIIREENIKIITWREIGKAWKR